MSSGVRFGKNLVIFGVPNSCPVQADNRKKDIFIFGKGPRDGLDHTAVTTVTTYSISFTDSNESTVKQELKFFIADGVKICQFKEKDSKINSYSLFSHDFSVDYDINDIDDILDIYKNLMEKHIKK